MDIDGHEFTKATQLETWEGTDRGGIYSIMYITPGNMFSILYIGQTSEFSARGIKSHEKIPCCNKNSNNSVLYISILYVNNYSSRKLIEEELIREYNPPCNIKYN